MKDVTSIKSILATDCGSTTTKAILIEKQGDEYRLVTRGEAPTTVEAPFDDVTVGVLNSVTEVEELRGRKMLTRDGKILTPQNGEDGVDIYISTSSAGGGLQMMVGGVVRNMTAESAERAALGAGAIVMDTLASNDGRRAHEKIEVVRSLRPDMILLSGGVDGGTTSHIAEMAELLAAADPRPRLGQSYSLPVVYAGNTDARNLVDESLGDKTSLTMVDNLRPTLERENLGPAREKIHELFMEHVMAQAPGYPKLMSWVDAPIMPTPGAVGAIIQTIAGEEKINVMGVDIGGATTDIFSVFEGSFNRTVSANLGMSYSISNVLSSAGMDNIMRWVPLALDENEIRNRIKNKMIRPTTIPVTLDDLMVEQAIAKEALRLALLQHKSFATQLKGVQQERTISDTFEQTASGETLIHMMKLDLLVGSGGVLSHAPRRHQSAAMLIDAFLPEGITRLAVDSIFMMPHLGVLSTLHPKAAAQVFHRDCLILLGTCIAPVGEEKPGKRVAEFKIERNGSTQELELGFGELKLLPLELGEMAKVTVLPSRSMDVGAGKGQEVSRQVEGGVVGLVLDGRGRPRLSIPETPSERLGRLQTWFEEMQLYPTRGS